MKKKTKIIIAILIGLVILCPFYLYYENTKLQISTYNITNEKIPDTFNNYKIVQVSDFHNTKNKKLAKDLVEEIKNQKPNTIVLTGDLIDANRTDVDVSISFVKELKEIAPIYFITGNHEVSTSSYKELEEKLIENGIVILDNKVEILKENDLEINLVGIDDPKIFNETFIEDSDFIQMELDQIDYNKENFTILLSHRPELFNIYVKNNIDLALTGHAHGGQVRIPFLGGLVAPNQGLFPKYTSGIFKENNTSMIVSRGIGNSILPFRINNRPELVVVTLKS